MKYVVDVDSLIRCVQLLPNYGSHGAAKVSLDDVIALIEAFPKDSPIINTPINYTGPIISTSPAVVPDTLKGWEVTCENA